MISCGKEDIKSIEVGISTISRSLASDGKSFFSKQLQGIKKDPENSRYKNEKGDDPSINNIEEPRDKENVIEYENAYNNDLYFCLDLKGLWKMLRECGIITPTVSLALIDRIYFLNMDNYIDMYYLPDELEEKNKKKEEFDKIYDYLYQRMQKSKDIFDAKYKTENEKKNEDDNNDEKGKIDKKEIDIDFHDEKNVILLRYFYELLIRIAFVRFSEDGKMTFENKVKLLFEVLKLYFKNKRKGSLDLSINVSYMIDPNLRNFDNILETYITKHRLLLYDIFTELYKYSSNLSHIYKSYDMTITYKFFFDNIILNSENLSKLFENKKDYIDIISVYFKDKKHIPNQNKYNEDEICEFIIEVLNYEMIFREFCELIFFISRKYFKFYEIDTEEEDNKGRILTQEEIEKKKEENRKKKKKTKVKKNEYDDIYMQIIHDITEAKNKIATKNYKGIKYFYPKLNTHITIEKLREEERLRKLEEERKAQDKIRFEKERKAFKEEDINAYKEENDEEKSNSDYSED
jgi:hypothetical protein